MIYGKKFDQWQCIQKYFDFFIAISVIVSAADDKRKAAKGIGNTVAIFMMVSVF